MYVSYKTQKSHCGLNKQLVGLTCIREGCLVHLWVSPNLHPKMCWKSTIDFIFLCFFNSLQCTWPFSIMDEPKIPFATSFARWHNHFCHFPVVLKQFLQFFGTSVLRNVFDIKSLNLRMPKQIIQFCKPRRLYLSCSDRQRKAERGLCNFYTKEDVAFITLNSTEIAATINHRFLP